MLRQGGNFSERCRGNVKAFAASCNQFREGEGNKKLGEGGQKWQKLWDNQMFGELCSLILLSSFGWGALFPGDFARWRECGRRNDTGHLARHKTTHAEVNISSIVVVVALFIHEL